MTHHDIYKRLARFDVKSSYVWLGYLIIGVVVLFIAAALVPRSWLEIFTSDTNPRFLSMQLDENTRFLIVPMILTSPLLVGSLVIGIGTAAESRSYLGAGITRTAAWWDARRSNIGIAIVFTLLIVITTLIALLLDGGASDFDLGQSLTSGGLFLLGLVAAFEVGYFISLLYTRYDWIPATLATIIYSGVLFLAITEQINEEREAWVWYRILAVVILVVITPPGSYRMLTTLPMRRSG